MGDRLPEQTRANPSPAVAASSEAEAIEVLETEDVLPMATEDNHRVGRNQSSSTPTCCPKARLPTHRPPTDQPLLSRTQSDTSRGQKHARKCFQNKANPTGSNQLIDEEIGRHSKFDPENTGYISTEKFRNLLQRHGSELDPHKLEVLLALADNNSDGKICYQDFVNLMSNKRSNSFRQAILQGNRRLCSKALLEETGLSLSQRLIRHVAYETLPREIDRKWYYDSYTCCPPPWFIIAITIVEVAFFLYNGVVLDRFVLQVTHPLYLKNSLLYHPQLRAQAWRYLTYIFMHAGIEHLGLNVVLQLLVGVPLEMVHGAARIGFVYIAGVVAGSLAVSIADMTAPVVGSSGGVYALISAHLANIVMNWSGMKCQFKLLRMAVALICMSFEFGRAVWLRFYPSAYPPCPHPSFVAHLGGVAVGITLGVVILRNYEQRLQDQSLWWIFVSMYMVFVLFAIFWNIFAYNLLDLKLPPPP
ncbi:rhomboid-related protein 3 isoform X1 [Hemicordylus capensis]|uniref:rhomboid-related protein 3 isoform X1 n=2 Tax=Hemicordylus capensis TaxID=884348 RepID=UPI002303AA90|nr:rhomboid-related protein 3 isoform X1 [Hemicordylus capensis]